MPLPDNTNWCFDNIAADDADRAERLENALSPDKLIAEVITAFQHAALSNNVRYGWERASDPTQGNRAVIQFKIGMHLYDQLFNSRTGYRAHFRQHPETGIHFNDLLIEALVRISTCNPVQAISLNESFEVVESVIISRDEFFATLPARLSKLWYCGRRIEPDRVLDLSFSLTGPRLILGVESWPSIFADDENAWVDVKGAFGGAYQPKDPTRRAEELHRTGTT